MFRMMRVRQLSGGGLSRNVPYWIETIWCGVLIETAFRWLAHCGWGTYQRSEWVPFLQANMPVAAYAPLRLRLKGRCWIEDSNEPAVFCRDDRDRPRPDGEPFAGILPPLQVRRKYGR